MSESSSQSSRKEIYPLEENIKDLKITFESYKQKKKKKKKISTTKKKKKRKRN